MKSLFIVFILFSGNVLAQVDCKERLIKTETSNGIIMPESSSAYAIPKSFQRFTPTKLEIIDTEKSLKTEILEINKDHPNQWEKKQYLENNLSTYNRQYFGYINEKGEKLIYVNLFKEPIDCEMDTELVVLDGCSSYWQIKYVLPKQKFKDFSVNGCA